MTTFERRDVGDREPAYVFRSPCCGCRELVSAWVVAYAVRRPDRTLRLRCGRSSADPLRAAGTGRRGCGGWFRVTFSPPPE